jgi:hypothetical protein
MEKYMPSKSSYLLYIVIIFLAVQGVSAQGKMNAEIPPGAVNEFSTDFTISSVPFSEIMSGGPSKDGIPAVDRPRFVSIAMANEWLGETEPVITVSIDNKTRIYPLQILMWHEIVNDTIGEMSVVVTYCPLCNTAIVFSGQKRGVNHNFGTTGRLRYSNLIMYDRTTESWWQQATGEAIIGDYTGERLEVLPSLLLPWGKAAETYPDAEVLSPDTGHSRPYGNNPYRSYDDPSQKPFLYSGPEAVGPLNPLDRVLYIELSGESVSVSYKYLKENRSVQFGMGEKQIIVIWSPGTSSALDSYQLRDGRDVGTANAYFAESEGRRLMFFFDGKVVRDRETNSAWDYTGVSTEGPLKGGRLGPAPGIQHFWFSSYAFSPELTLY